MIISRPFECGDIIPVNTKLPWEQIGVLTNPDRRGMYWIRIRKQWLLVLPFTDFSNGYSTSLAIIEAKERW